VTPLPAAAVPFREALGFWIRLGFISFGGPAGQIAIMHREIVERRRWISEERFLHALNFCMLLPGPEAQQLATYIGWLLHRTRGGIVAGVFFVAPSIFILLGLSYVYAAYGSVTAVAGVLAGFKPVVVAIVLEAVVRIGRRTLTSRTHVLIAAGAFVAVYSFSVPFPVVVLTAGLTGLLTVSAVATANAGRGVAPDLLPEHAVPSRRRTYRTLAVGLLLWIIPLIALAGWRGWGSLHIAEYAFFTQAALVTFGGAYAILTYVSQAAVSTHGWLTQAQMVDGLALAETTPGPLIMVLQFVGFMASWNHPEGMSPAASAVTGALVATYATFLPSFLFIFVGAPYVEALRNNQRIWRTLRGITASVVGVVLNLGVVFATAVIWPSGFSGGTDGFAAIIVVAAFCVLTFLKLDVLWVVLAGGLAGLARGFLR
jgi:chromate transporter